MSYKEIGKYLKRYKKDVYLTMSLSLVIAGLYAIIPIVYGQSVDLVIQENIGGQLLVLLGLWLIVSLIITRVNRYLVIKKYNIAINCEKDLVVTSNAHLLELPLSFHKEEKIGGIFEKIDRAGSNLGNIIGQVVFSTLPQLFTTVVILVVLFWISYKLSFVILIIIIVYGAVTLLKIKPLTEVEGKLSKAYERANGDICDSVINTKAVKSFAAEQQEKQKYQNRYQRVVDEHLSLLNIWSKIQMIQSNIMEIGFIVIFGVSLMLLGQKEITAGQLVMIVGYVNLIYKPLSSLSENYIMIKRGMVSIRRVESLLQEETESYDGILLSQTEGEVEFRDVLFSYNGGDEILTDVNFIAKSGETIALVGRSGAGKSTLVDMVSRFTEPKKGIILLDGIDISRINLHSLRKNIASVPQELILFNTSIEDNIRFGKPDATDEEVIQAAVAANAHEFIQRFPDSYKQLVGERGIKLSAGQKQRIAIARAIIRDPKILILDEATSALDSKSEKLVQEALDKLIKGKTTFIIAHRLSTIRNADKILVLENGRIVEQGTHEELLTKKGAYKELYDLQKF